MLDNWIADVVGRMHVAGITGQQLAKECGYNSAYLSMVLNGNKGVEKTRRRICESLSFLIDGPAEWISEIEKLRGKREPAVSVEEITEQLNRSSQKERYDVCQVEDFIRGQNSNFVIREKVREAIKDLIANEK